MYPRYKVGVVVHRTNEKTKGFIRIGNQGHDMEAMIASRHGNSFYSTKSKKDKFEFNKNVKFSKSMTNKVMSISIGELI